jgi:hypothetical protein
MRAEPMRAEPMRAAPAYMKISRVSSSPVSAGATIGRRGATAPNCRRMRDGHLQRFSSAPTQ